MCKLTDKRDYNIGQWIATTKEFKELEKARNKEKNKFIKLILKATDKFTYEELDFKVEKIIEIQVQKECHSQRVYYNEGFKDGLKVCPYLGKK